MSLAPSLALCEIINAAFDERLELVARCKLGNVAVQAGTCALSVSHLAQHATVGAGNAFNSPNGSVGIDREIHAWDAFRVNILRGNLTCVFEACEKLLGSHEATLAMADGNGVDVAGRTARKPWRQRGCHASANEFALVATDCVESECRTGVVHGANVAVRNESQFNQGLEAVTNTQYKAVAVVQESADCFGDLRRSEQRADELGGTVGLVAARESAGDHDNLAAVDLCGECVCGLGNVRSRKVVDDERRGLGTGSLKGTRNVVFAVVTWENGDYCARSCGAVECKTAVFVSYGSTVKRDRFNSVNIPADSAILNGADTFVGILTCTVAAIREHSLKRTLPCFLQPSEVDLLATRRKRVLGGGDSKWSYGNAVNVIKGSSGFKLDDKRTVCRREEFIGRIFRLKLNADSVAQAALEKHLGISAVAGCGNCKGSSGARK